MAKGLKELQREVQGLHEKARQDAISKLKGEQLDAALEKIDELYKPLENLSSYSQIGTKLTKNRFAVLMLMLFSGVILYCLAERYFNSVLFFNEKMNLIALFFVFPLMVSGVFYLIFLNLLRAQSRGIRLSFMDYSPLIRYPMMFLFSTIVGACLLFLIYYLPMSVGMKIMNTQNVEVDSIIVDIKSHSGNKSLFDCRVSASREGQGNVNVPSEVSFVLPSRAIDWPLKQGDKAQIIGRKSFAGIVVDRIQKAP